MSQATAAIANMSRTLFRAAVNAMGQAIQSQNSGLIEPSETYPFMLWADTTTGLLKQRNSSDNAWIDVCKMSNWALSSVQSQAATAFTTAGTSTAYTLTTAPALAAYAAGQSFWVTFAAAAGASPTIEISGVSSPPNLVKQMANGDYVNIAANDFPANHRSRVTLLSASQALVEKLPALSTQMMHVRDEKSVGTHGGSSLSGLNIRVLNTVARNTITGASLASNQVTLPAGTYRIWARCPIVSDIALHKAVVYNVTDAANALVGPSARTYVTTPAGQTDSIVVGSITTTGTKVFELRDYTTQADATTGLGQAFNVAAAGVEVYAEMIITKE